MLLPRSGCVLTVCVALAASCARLARVHRSGPAPGTIGGEKLVVGPLLAPTLEGDRVTTDAARSD